MSKKGRLLLLLSLCSLLCLSGCRKRPAETEPETTAETAAPAEPVTEKKTEKKTEKQPETSSEKKTEKQSETQKSTKKTSVKPGTNTTAPTTTGETAQCPYCYQQISTAPNPDGTTVYSVHVAQEKAWADMYGYGDTPPLNQQTDASQAQTDAAQQTDASQQTDAADDDSRQCGYCYQWFTVSDGSYAAHLAAENAQLGLPEGTEYITCPICGNAYPKGNLYDTHVCITE